VVIWLESQHLDLVAKVQGLDADVRLLRVIPLLPLVNHLQEAVMKSEQKKKRRKKS